jgi:hypothetical protein
MTRQHDIATKSALFAFAICLTALSGIAYAGNPVVGGKSLRLIGSGLREFLFIDIYSLAAYSQSGDCAPGKIVYNNEPKSMRLKMARDIPAGRLTSNLRETFEDNLPKNGDVPGLKKKIDDFLGRFKNDLKEGAYVEINYVPGKGTSVKENGKAMGAPVPGRDFAELIWRSYFGGNTCCKSLKADIIKQCKAR